VVVGQRDAATYTGGDTSSTDAHQRRTALLESLTRDMTNRTDRAGDTIASFGGSLRLVLGGRISRARTEAGNTQKRDYAVWGPLSLPLGFGLDVLGGKPGATGSDARGFHLELGILDLGQYLSFDGAATLETPDVTSAFAPSVTLGYAFGRELPFIVGVTGGFTPAYDFDPKRDDDRRGAWMVGVTAGVYVPLFDFN
jgi:hypothetical protein